MVSLNVFQQDAFRTIQLTSAIEKAPYNPNGLGAMGIFEDKPIRTRALMVEQRQGKLVLLPFSARGSAGTQRTTEQRTARYFECPRIKDEDTIYADELAGIRAFGSETELMQLQSEVARRLAGPTGLRAVNQFTQEYHRLAAVQGLLLDSDGTTKFNWYNEFGITANPTVPFGLASNTARTVRPAAASIVREMQRKAQGAFINSTSVVALCGDAFYDSLVTHTDVEKTYANWQAAVSLRQGTAFKDFEFADITWVNYRGSDDTIPVSTTLTNGQATFTVPSGFGIATGMSVSGQNIPANSTITVSGTTATLSGGNYTGTTGTYTVNIGGGTAGGGAIAIPTNKAIFFPKGAPGVFQRGLAPAESAEWVNTLGKPEYVRVIPDRDRDEWVKLELSTYPLHICTRPEVLFSATMDGSAD